MTESQFATLAEAIDALGVSSTLNPTIAHFPRGNSAMDGITTVFIEPDLRYHQLGKGPYLTACGKDTRPLGMELTSLLSCAICVDAVACGKCFQMHEGKGK